MTDKCDVFASFHEDGFNQIIKHIRRQRPSLFNYASANLLKNLELLCKTIDVHPIVLLRSNPLVTVVDPLPIPGTNYGINFAVQLADLLIDFHPGKKFNLPSELNPPLKEQRFAIKLTLCVGIGCPSDDIVDRLIPIPVDTERSQREVKKAQNNHSIVVLPTRKLTCFCLDAFVIGGIRIAYYDGIPYMEPYLDGFEIVDIDPSGLESSLECYISLMMRLVILPGLRILLQYAPLNLTQGATDLFPAPTNVVLSPMPMSSTLPNNPAIEDDQLKAFIKVEVS